VIEARIAKIAMVASLALFAFVVTFDNITDYDTNFEFVRHVLNMDAISPGSTLLYRRVMSPALWNFAYWLIIIGEGITSLALGIAALALLRHLRSDGARFNRAKRFVFIGATLGFLVWFFGSWWSAASGFRCGNPRSGMASKRLFAFI
jgi:predicted small integral membrane protein